ncbi:MAG: alpha/beta hydrolase fold protein [Herminiimonas sp.]|nr:alpha/beta hydrolase fold protein [Herminiimonas sp.]
MENISWRAVSGALHTGSAAGPATALPIVTVHGMSTGHASFQPLLRSLSDEFRLYSWSVPGYTGADPVADPSDAARYGDRLIEFIEGVVKRPVVLLGHSLGTLITANAAGRRSELVRGLVLANPVAGLRDESEKTKDERVGTRVKALAQQGVEQFCAQRVPGIFAPGAPAPMIANAIEVARAAVTVDAFTAAGELLCGSSLIDMLRDYHGPLRLVTGQLDAVSTAALLHTLAEGRKDVELEVIEGCGHSAHLERAEEFRMGLRAFARQCQ